jgi:hypothetical protein
LKRLLISIKTIHHQRPKNAIQGTSSTSKTLPTNGSNGARDNANSEIMKALTEQLVCPLIGQVP